MRILANLSRFCLFFTCILFTLLDASWTNWGQNQVCSPKDILCPSNLEEIKNIIKQASQENINIRFIGSGHSWSDLVCTNGYLINTDKLNKILSIDHKSCRVKVESGIKLKDLIPKLANEGLALSNQGFITEQSIAGATATATHGSGHTGTLSDFITQVELLDSQGNMHVISDKYNSEWLPATRVSLGALGFIYSMTIQCEPLFKLSHKRKLITLPEVLAMHENLYRANDYFMFMLNPLTDTVLSYTSNKTAKPLKINYLNELKESIITSKIVKYLGVRSCSIFPAIARQSLENLLHAMEREEYIDYGYKILSPLRNPVSVSSYIEEEIAIPIEHFIPALLKARELYRRYSQAANGFIGVITCRFAPAQYTCYLSPSFGRETAYITINILSYFSEYENFFKEFESIMAPYSGRPHWGKFHHLDKEKIIKLYGDNAVKYNNIRKKLDPDNIFANNFIKRCFE